MDHRKFHLNILLKKIMRRLYYKPFRIYLWWTNWVRKYFAFHEVKIRLWTLAEGKEITDTNYNQGKLSFSSQVDLGFLTELRSLPLHIGSSRQTSCHTWQAPILKSIAWINFPKIRLGLKSFLFWSICFNWCTNIRFRKPSFLLK